MRLNAPCRTRVPVFVVDSYTMKHRILLVWLIMCLGTPVAAPGLEVLIQGERLTLKAQNDRLTDILEEFVHAGVAVSIDPSIDASVTGSLEDEDLQSALDALLEKFSYVLVWEVVEGPLGKWPKLSEIQIFKPEKGYKKDVKPFHPPGANLEVTRGPLESGPLFVTDEILLAFRAGFSVEQFKKLLREIGGTIVDSIPHLGIYRVRVPRGTNILALVDQLNQNNLVAVAEPNYVFQTPTPNKPSDAHREPEDREPPERLADGAPPVAVLDSGLMDMAALDPFVVGELDALDPDRPLIDHSGHGTQMALIASGTVAPHGTSGSADAVPVVAIRSFDDNGYASNFSVMRSIEYASEQGAKVLSMSWGTEAESTFLQRAVQEAQQQGMVVVASAGNVPDGDPVYPAAYSGVISVSAMNPDSSMWESSNYGDTIFLAAPGRADFPVGHDGPPGSYAGTSIGTPYVARELSLYFGRHPDSSPNEAVSALRGSLSDLGDTGKDPYYGYGAFDSEAVSTFQSK